jgi:serine/threonine protein kinase
MSDDFGNYRLLEKIGGGGLGEVFRAETADGSVVALKRLAREHLANQEYAALFAQESQVANRLQHDRLLGALDSGIVDDWPFLTTRLATGGSLHQRLDATDALGVEMLASLATDLGEALAAMHAHGFTHSDLSPGNVLFVEDRALLADFSAATPMGQSQARPQGTYAYMCPEQVRGEQLDARSDLFSLATLLWQCVTGEKIFWRDAQHLCFMAVVEAELPAMPSALRPVEDVLRAALHKEQAERPTDVVKLCRQFVAALKL